MNRFFTTFKSLGPRQRWCWTWQLLPRKQKAELLSVMTRDKSLSLAHRNAARRKLYAMRKVDAR